MGFPEPRKLETVLRLTHRVTGRVVYGTASSDRSRVLFQGGWMKMTDAENLYRIENLGLQEVNDDG